MFTPPVEMLPKADPHKGNDKTRILLCKYLGHEEYDYYISKKRGRKGLRLFLTFCHVRPSEIFVLASCNSSLKQMEKKRTRRERVPEERDSKCSLHPWKCFQKQILTKAMTRHVYCCVNIWNMRNMITIYPRREDVEVSGSF